MNDFQLYEKFENRHLGPNESERNEMLNEMGFSDINDLMDKTIPKSIKLKRELKLDEPISEYEYINKLRKIASKNKIYKNYIGLGYYPVITPPVIQRNILENPGWYTQYTPYQAEISQGRLEALLNFQTVITDLTGHEIANASLLDEGTAAAEAIIMCHNIKKGKKQNANTVFVSDECFPQTIDVIKTRAVPQGINVIVGDHKTCELSDDIFAVIVQNPGSNGEVFDYTGFFKDAKEKQIFTIIASDILSLIYFKTPAEQGADISVGSTQRLGVPMAFGGPHAAYFATKDEFKRHIPGRIIGISIDSKGNPAYRMALQTREQHIRREKATSNICTSQVLLAIMAGMYAVYHGEKGMKEIVSKIFKLTRILDKGLSNLGYNQLNNTYFDTLKISSTKDLQKIIKKSADAKQINLRYENEYIFISLNETNNFDDINDLLEIFDTDKKIKNKKEFLKNTIDEADSEFPEEMLRKTSFLKHEVFNKYHSETELLRYIKSLENKDLSLTGSMIPLGSCTMKLNATTEMLGISMPEFLNIHPFAPLEQAAGYIEIIKELEKDLCEITGFAGISLQPNSGAQGEYTGLMVIRAFHIKNGNKNRNVVLIPESAHGTNPASGVMAGMKVVVVNCDDNGNIDSLDLEKKAEMYKDNLSALMVTYPSTHGVFEENIKEICEVVHKYGGQVYMDGANMNAQVGYTSPAMIGADVCHLNLHKTFCIPHGGGGPGVGPIAVAKHLVPFLPGHSIVKIGTKDSIGAVSSAPWGSAGVLSISYSYIKMMGTEGLKKATETAILNANYIKSKLEKYYKVLFSGSNNTVAHELIFDLNNFKHDLNIEAEDLSKRLMDYGFHAPTVSFPVHGTFMVEPTESESKAELDRFCDAMIAIREEIREVETGTADPQDNVLKNAPHTALAVSDDDWNHKYSREKAAYPIHSLKLNKFWPSVGRINNAYGDRNLVCSCAPIAEYKSV
jgi:glycine dehydrogenase